MLILQESRLDGSTISVRETKEKSDRNLGVEVLVTGTVSVSKDKDLPTPCSTPTTSRKTRRRSNLFPVSFI